MVMFSARRLKILSCCQMAHTTETRFMDCPVEYKDGKSNAHNPHMRAYVKL